jgi:hypothetical protein
MPLPTACSMTSMNDYPEKKATHIGIGVRQK